MPGTNAALEMREVGEQDLDALLAVYMECEDFLALGPIATASPEMVREDLNSARREGGLFCGIFNAAGEIIGVADYVRQNFRGQPDVAYLALLMLKQRFRGRGIGTQALEIIETEIRRNPRVSVLRAGVMVNNPDAIWFWTNRGFVIVSGPETLPDRTTVFRLEKKIR